MIWRFTIYDRNNVATVVDEPVGFDNNMVEVKRDLNWHGLFFNVQGDTFEFDGEAMQLLKAEYEQYGSQGNMTLVIAEDCGNGYQEFTRGKFDFNRYKYFCGDRCYVKILLEKTGDIIDLRDRSDQKVNLETLLGFDEVTALPAYDKLPFDLVLPSKGIPIQDYFLNDANNGTPVQGAPLNNNPGVPANSSTQGNSDFGSLELAFNKQVASEIGNAGTELQPKYNCVLTAAGSLGCNSLNRFLIAGISSNMFIAPLDMSPTVNFQDGTPNYDSIANPCQLDINIKAKITIIKTDKISVRFLVMVLPKGASGMVSSDYIYYSNVSIADLLTVGTGNVINLNQTYTNNSFVLSKGDQLYAFYAVYHYRYNSTISTGQDSFSINYEPDSYFKLSNLSKTPVTTSKVFMVNEALSRITEAITNNKLKAYSEYFGRTDSFPYAHGADGCGSLEVITDGLRIRRQENKIPGKTNLCTVSLVDMFEGLAPIHNIGMGIEPDSNRAGFNRLRIESWEYFYSNNVIMSCTGINKLSREAYEKEIYSTFKFGYAKWEAEEYTGLDEFLTKRNYRTMLSGVKNELTKLSKFISSGYAWEITRRKGNYDTKDWRYDKDIFIGCCKRDNQISYRGKFRTSGVLIRGLTVLPSWAVVGTQITISSAYNNGLFNITSAVITTGQGLELGFLQSTIPTFFPFLSQPLTVQSALISVINIEQGNVTAPVNIVDPTSLYNFRISPIRNAMRWMNRVLESYRQFDANAKILFTDGDGNYFAEGEMTSATCKLESGSVAENSTLNSAKFADIEDARPFLLPERVVYDYPMNSQQFKIIENNPRGKIFFQNECDEGFGFIDSIIYRPEEGMASFNLIPSLFNGTNTGLTTEDGIQLTTENNINLVIE